MNYGQISGTILQMQFKPKLFFFCGSSTRTLPHLGASLVASILLHGLILSTLGVGWHRHGARLDPDNALPLTIRVELVDTVAFSAPLPPVAPVVASETLPPIIEDSPIIEEIKPVIPEVPPAPVRSVSVPAISSPGDDPAAASSEVDQAPVFEQPFKPKPPLLAYTKGLRGSVTASFRIGKEGTPEDIQIISSSAGGAFDSAIIEALKNTRIKPDSVRAQSLMQVTVVFDPFGTNLQGSFLQQAPEIEQQNGPLAH